MQVVEFKEKHFKSLDNVWVTAYELRLDEAVFRYIQEPSVIEAGKMLVESARLHHRIRAIGLWWASYQDKEDSVIFGQNATIDGDDRVRLPVCWVRFDANLDDPEPCQRVSGMWLPVFWDVSELATKFLIAKTFEQMRDQEPNDFSFYERYGSSLGMEEPTASPCQAIQSQDGKLVGVAVQLDNSEAWVTLWLPFSLNYESLWQYHANFANLFKAHNDVIYDDDLDIEDLDDGAPATGDARLPIEFSMDSIEKDILLALSRHDPVAQKQTDIAENSGYDEKTIRSRLPKLEEEGFIERLVKRKGYALTPNGRTLISKLQDKKPPTTIS